MPGSGLTKLPGSLARAQTAQAAEWELTEADARAREKVGYAIVLTVHDEVICEAPDTDDWNPDHLSALLAENPPWADGLPLAAAGFEAYRYRKDEPPRRPAAGIFNEGASWISNKKSSPKG